MISYFLPRRSYSGSLYSLRLSVFFVVCKIFRVYHAGTKSEENFPSSMGEIGIREPDG